MGKAVRKGGLGFAPLEFDMLQKLYCLHKAGNCFDVVMNVLYSPVLTHSLIFCSYKLLCRSV